MIRQALRLAYEAAKVEAHRWLHPEPAGVEPPPKSEAYRRGWLESDLCPFCIGGKVPGTEMCGPCDKKREPLRKLAKGAPRDQNAPTRSIAGRVTNVENAAGARPRRIT
jgi:hypothetical protein